MKSTNIKAEAGRRVSITFSVTADPRSGEISSHSLEKDGDVITAAYSISGNEVVFDKVSVRDRGAYTISCSSEGGRGTITFILDIIPKGMWLK